MNIRTPKSFHPKDFEKRRYLTDIKLLKPLREEKAQQYAVLVFTIITLSLFGVFAINPTLTTILELRKKLDDSKLVNGQLDKKIADMSSLQRQYDQLVPDLPVIYAAVPEQPEVAMLLGQLQAIAVEENVTILDLQSYPAPIRADKKTEKKEKDPSFEFTLKVTGAYDEMQNFLRGVTAFDRVITVTAVTIGRDGGTETSPLEMVIRGRAYYQYEN